MEKQISEKQIEELAEKYRKRMYRYKDVYENTIYEHHQIRFAAKYQATRDCYYELLQLIGKDPRYKG